MSEAAKTLFFFLNNAELGCADDSDVQYCQSRAKEWAAAIIAGTI